MRILRNCGIVTFIVLISTVLPSPVSFADESTRILHFPSDRSMGRLYAREFGKTKHSDWQQVGEAVGEVELPEEMERKLQLSKEGCADLAPLSALWPDDLQELGFLFFPGGRGSPLKNEQLAHISHLTSLKRLHISTNPVGDAGLIYLKGFTSLEELHLYDTGITDAGLVHLKRLTALRTLWIGDNQITDEGLIHIKALPRLESLSLSETQITDAGFAHLAEMTSLRKLYLNETDTSARALARLRRELPNAKIYSPNMHGADDVFLRFSFVFLVVLCVLMLILDRSFTRGESWKHIILLAGAAGSLLFLATVLPMKIYNLRHGLESPWREYLQIIGMAVVYGVGLLLKLFFEESVLSRMAEGTSVYSGNKGVTTALALSLGYAAYWGAVLLLTGNYYHGDHSMIFFLIIPWGIGASILGGVVVGVVHGILRRRDDLHTL